MKHSHAKAQLLYFCSDRLLNSPTMAGFLGECFKGAGTLLNLSASLFRDSMHSMGISLLVARCTFRPVLGTFTEAPLTLLSHLLLISSISVYTP